MKFETIRIDDKPTLFIPILSHPNKHWVVNKISFIYCFNLETEIEYIIGINHNDMLQSKLPMIYSTDYVYSSKFLNSIGIEAKILVWLQNAEISKHRLPTNSNIDCYPIMKLLPMLRLIKNEFVNAFKQFNNFECLQEYNKFQQNLATIEHNGLFTTNNEYEYSEYNLYTLTARPSNNFKNINYAALNKNDGTRSRFISRFGSDGILIEFDLKAFHIYLLSQLIDYTWPTLDIYEYFGRYYDEGVNAKEETFHQLYGGINEKYLNIEFFAKVNDLTNNLYEQYKTNSLKSILYNRNITSPNLTKVKVLNYILQSFETEFNAILLNEIQHYLYTHNSLSKLILYTYDSFLIDFNKKDGRTTLIELQEIFQKIPFRMQKGYNYNDIC